MIIIWGSCPFEWCNVVTPCGSALCFFKWQRDPAGGAIVSDQTGPLCHRRTPVPLVFVEFAADVARDADRVGEGRAKRACRLAKNSHANQV